MSVRSTATGDRYSVFVPRHWHAGEAWPVILFLHGAGERGDDGEAPTRVGLGPWVPDDFGGVVVFPQCLKDHFWTEPAMLGRALAAFDDTVEEFEGDPHRLYLCGVSMGGYGAWSLAAQRPHQFAALVAICGGYKGDPVEGAGRLKPVPTWAFHGELDDIIPVSESRKIVAALRAEQADIRYTEYAAASHNVWDRTFQEPDLWPWLFSQRRS